MNPFFFGSSSQPLYGVYHPQSAQPMKKEAILLCPPFGQEYMRSHRAFRQLAMLLARQGFPVMRFDYRGTGDSSGDIEDVTLAGWLEDIEVAIEELQETAGVERINVVGLRLGALLASAALSRMASDNKSSGINKLILWDPINSGEAYDRELQEEMVKEGASACNLIDENGTLHFNGFPLVKSMRDDLSSMDLLTLETKAEKVFHVVSEEHDSATVLKECLSQNKNYVYEHASAPGNWNYVDAYGGILLPQPVIQAIVNWMSS